MKKYSIIILTIVIALISQSILAYPLLSKDRLKDQIKGYAEQNMLPKLLEWKSTLDKGLSTDDLSTLNALREQAAALKISRIQLTKDIVSAKDIEDEETSEMLKKRISPLKESYKNLLNQLKPIATNNRNLLLNIGKEAAPSLIEWKKSIRDLIKKEIDANPDMKTEIEKTVKKYRIFQLFKDEQLKKKIALARFMLWNGNSDILNNENEE
jgi:vacuolar-type H+-ATPase subunit I/STV1